MVEPLVACCVLLWFCVGSGQLAPGCHHKVFGAASNVVYSYAGPSLTGVNHRAGNMDLGNPGDGMESDEWRRKNSEAAQIAPAPNLRSRSLVVL